jgi:hypothetical protein
LRNGFVVQKQTPPTQTAQTIPPARLKPLPPALTLKLQAPGEAADRLMPGPSGGGNTRHLHQNRMPSFGAARVQSGAVAAQSSATVSGAEANQALQTESPAVGGIVAADQAQAVSGRRGLPSGLPSISTVANARQVVAIDTRNTLFFSNDAGAHWSVITQPWQGRAVKVELVGASYSTGELHGVIGAVGGIAGGAAPHDLVEGPKATLSGNITDPTGASIPNASVAVTNSLTQAVRRTTTDPTGRYTVDQIEPGTYTVEAEAPGFTPREFSGLALHPAQQGQMDLALAVGSMAQTVVVQGPAQLALAAPKVTKKIAAARAAAPTARRFEITTDAGEHWISTDGRSWQRKDGEKPPPAPEK